MRGILVGALALAGLITTSTSASAHASIQLYGEKATPGGYGVLFVRIPHGCTGGLTTDKVVVSIPDGFASVRPQLVAGFTAGRTMSGTTVTEVHLSGGIEICVGGRLVVEDHECYLYLRRDEACTLVAVSCGAPCNIARHVEHRCSPTSSKWPCGDAWSLS